MTTTTFSSETTTTPATTTAKTTTTTKKKVLFVCLGNICRSPTCEGICRLVSQGAVEVHSCSTSSWHRNECPDERSQEICMKHGIDISGHRARAIRNDDWEYFDVVAALDPKVLEVLEGMRPRKDPQTDNNNNNNNVNSDNKIDNDNNSKDDNKDDGAKLVLFCPPDGIGDPYYGGRSGFQKMFQQIYNSMMPFLLANELMSEDEICEKF